MKLISLKSLLSALVALCLVSAVAVAETIVPPVPPMAPEAPALPAAPVAPTVAELLDGDPIKGKAKSEPCAACHGVDGNSPIPMYPKIAGQYEVYLLQSLTEYQKGPEGTRNNPIMYGMVAGLSHQDIADLAAYYASEKQTVGMTDPQYLALGERLYRGGNASVPACIACHGPKGEGNSLANFPRIGGQNAEYIVSQLQAFRSGARGPGVNDMMKDVADRMTDEEITAVSSYISGLH